MSSILRAGAPALAATLAALLLSDCSSSPGLPAGPPAAAGNAQRATATFAVKVPRAQRSRRRERYVSPSSKSMSITIVPSAGGAPAATVKLNLTAASDGCAPVTGGIACTVTVSLPGGSYLATVATYDGVNESGNVLSLGEKLPMTLALGVANAISLTLGGVPHSLAVTGGGAAITGTQAAGFNFSGAGPLVVTALDADGNTIVGAGTPYAAKVTAGSGWSIAAPSPAAPNELQVTPGPKGSSATLDVSVAYDAATCASAGVVCSATFSATSKSIEYLFVTDCEKGCNRSDLPDSIDVYAPPYTGAPIAQLTDGVYDPIGLVVDANGDVFVSNCGSCFATGGDDVTEFSPPFTSASAPAATIRTGVYHVPGLAMNAKGDLFVWNCRQSCKDTGGSDTISRFTAPFSDDSAPATTITPLLYVGRMAVDSSGDLLLLGCAQFGCYQGDTDPASLLAYAAPYTGSAAVVTSGLEDPSVLAVDANGHAFVGQQEFCALPPCTAYDVLVFSAPFSSNTAPLETLENDVDFPQAIATDASGNLYVSNWQSKSVYEYAAPSFSDASPAQIFASLGYKVQELVFDREGDAFVTDGSTVQMSSPPYTSLTPIAGGLSLPGNLALSP